MNNTELISRLRSHINPAYANQRGTESYERRECADALEAQAKQIVEVKADLETAHTLCKKYHKELDALRSQEPVGVVDSALNGGIGWVKYDDFEDGQELYSAPVVPAQSAQAAYKLGRNDGLEKAVLIAREMCSPNADDFGNGFNKAAIEIELAIESLKDNTP